MKTINSRKSLFVNIGRVYQSVSPTIRFFDYIPFLLNNNKTNNQPNIFLLAPPRSGSTLTYQLLISGIKNIHLTNLWNILFATPYIGGLINGKVLNEDYISAFSSNKGFVPGLKGEAEGLKFWSYWAGQTINETSNVDKKRLEYLVQTIEKLKQKFQKPFISGYLGHVLAIEQLKKQFGNILFINLKRDIKTNAYSLLRLSPKQMFSIRTKNINPLMQNRYLQIAKQIVSIHEYIYQHYDTNFYSITYKDICDNPKKFLTNFKDFAERHQFNIHLNNLNQIPDRFTISTIENFENHESEEFNNILKKEIKNSSIQDIIKDISKDLF